MTCAGVRREHPPATFGDLRQRGGAPALVAGDGLITYAQLADRVDQRAEELGTTRRLVMVEFSNDIEPLVTYLAALAAGHVVLPVPECVDVRQIIGAYQPDVVLTRQDDWRLDVHRSGSRHDLHPDLGLLLSTSGSTGAPKLVRLSRDNVRSNAESIAAYLELTPDDCGATTLPLHYCYGLSVVNSHLAAGARILLTDRSVVDDAFWAEFESSGATSFAGVPYTFDLLDSSGFAQRDLPSLRYVTQAGGRLAPDRVRRYARLGRERGFDFVVMYGATEATARMSYVPPALAEDRPTTIGIPIPGGTFRIDARDAQGVGELVYNGPNVMLGYAETAADLARGRTLHELHTGDLARQHEDGLYELVGRRSRTAKIFGLRIDLDRVEQLLADEGATGRAVLAADRVAVFVRLHRDVAVAVAVLSRCGLPAHATDVHVLTEFPRTSSGKTDVASLERHAELLRGQAAEGDRGSVTPVAVRDLYAQLLGRPDATELDSFASLCGDSLSFVEVSIGLGDLLGVLPRDWPAMSARELAERARTLDAAGRGSRRRRVSVETPVTLRALAIVVVVATHAGLLSLAGGAHVLLGVAGFNLARFQLVDLPRRQRVRHVLRAAGRVLVPTTMWIAGVALISGVYQLPTAVLLNNVVGTRGWGSQWHFWYLEVIVWMLAGAALLIALPGIDALERRRPLEFAAGVLAVTLAVRFLIVGVTAESTERYALAVVLWCVALGWVISRCQTMLQRLLISLVVAVSTPGFFGDPAREGVVIAGLLALIWLPAVRVPRLAASAISAVAAASLFVYLTHWQVYPLLAVAHPLLATLASIAVGLTVWKAYTHLARFCGSWIARPRSSSLNSYGTSKASTSRASVVRPRAVPSK